jgi:hypothetical protein
MWRNNDNATFTDVTETIALTTNEGSFGAVGTDYNNDRAVDMVVTGGRAPVLFKNPRQGKFPQQSWPLEFSAPTLGVAVLDFDHDGWMDLAFTHMGAPGLTLWRNNHGQIFEPIDLPKTDWVRAYGVAAIDYDNDGWVDLVAV